MFSSMRSTLKWCKPVFASPAFFLPVCATLLLPVGPRTPPGSDLASSRHSVDTEFYLTHFLWGSWTHGQVMTHAHVLYSGSLVKVCAKLLQSSPSWTRCRGCTLGERAGSPDSCSRSGPPTLDSMSRRSQPCPPGGAAAPPRTRPSWSKRCRTPAALSGTLEVVKWQKEVGRLIPEHVLQKKNSPGEKN